MTPGRGSLPESPRLAVVGSSEFAVVVDSAGPDRVVVRVCGELDMATTPQLEEALADGPHASTLVIDLTECTFLDSAGVRLITATLQGHEHVSLVTDDPAIKRVLEITALDTVASVHPTLDAAL